MLVTDPSTIQELRSTGVDVYDFSAISGSLRCPRYYQHRYEQGLALITAAPSYALEFGRSVHKSLEYWYENRDDNKAILLFAKEFKPFEEQPTLSPKTGKELDATYTVRFGCSLLDAYFTKHRNDTYTLIQNEIPVAEELVDGIFIAGRIDKIIEQNNKIKFIDHKTSKYPDKYTLNPNPQFFGYKFLCEKLTGKPVSGELDMLGVSKSKDLTTLLRREPFDYTPWQVSQWQKSTVSHIEQIRKWRSENFFPQYWNCKPFFHDCAFLPLCTLASEDAKESLVANLYVVSFWDPFAID